MKIYLASDHAGFKLKRELIEFLKSLSHEVVDKGPYTLDEADDYPDFMVPVAELVQKGDCVGIIMGGSGQGEAMVANRFFGVRAAVYYGPALQKSSGGQGLDDSLDIIRLSRQHNDANILSLGARFLTDEEAKNAVRVFLETNFSGDERHKRRLAKID